jgi:hypothetical protein
MQQDFENLSQFASFQYIADLPSYSRERPYHIFDDDVPKGVRRGNLDIRNGPEQFVEDVRHSADEFDLDVQGFIFKQNSLSEPTDWKNRDDIEQKYIPSVKSLVKDVLGGDICYCESICWRVSLLSNSPTSHVLTILILAAAWNFSQGPEGRRAESVIDDPHFPCISSPCR